MLDWLEEDGVLVPACSPMSIERPHGLESEKYSINGVKVVGCHSPASHVKCSCFLDIGEGVFPTTGFEFKPPCGGSVFCGL